jgi:hypothetical protein
VVFGAAIAPAIGDIERMLGAQRYQVEESRRPEFNRFIVKQLEQHMYRAYGAANENKTHGGANLAERAPLFPQEVAQIVRTYWRDAYWTESRAKSLATDAARRLVRLKVLKRTARDARELAPGPDDEWLAEAAAHEEDYALDDLGPQD